jgi:hypothetical protein
VYKQGLIGFLKIVEMIDTVDLIGDGTGIECKVVVCIEVLGGDINCEGGGCMCAYIHTAIESCALCQWKCRTK